jgi:4-hydroxy-2-oxoheptanedioate aldolase
MASPAKVQAVREKMQRGEVVVAVNLSGRNPDVIDHLARLGADVAFIDCERTGIGLDAATDLIRASRAADLPCVVRSWSRAPEALVRYLDRKADGIVVPHVDTPEEAASIVELVRYACGDAAASKLTIVQIETPKAVKAVDAMAAVPGVDVFLLGPNDLSYEMTGKRGSRTPEVIAAIEHCCARLRAAGRNYGMPGRIGEIAQFRALGATFLYYPVEWLLETGLEQLAKVARA